MMAARPERPVVDQGVTTMSNIGPVELVVVFLFLVVVAVIVVVAVVSSRAAERKRQLARQRAGAAGPTAPPGSIEARLLELGSLRTRGVITDDEYVAARRRAIDGQPGT